MCSCSTCSTLEFLSFFLTCALLSGAVRALLSGCVCVVCVSGVGLNARSLKIADVCMSSSMHVHLFVEILNQYLYYFEVPPHCLYPPPHLFVEILNQYLYIFEVSCACAWVFLVWGPTLCESTGVALMTPNGP